MINRTLNDNTQKSILPHLKKTEELLNRAVRLENSGRGGAEITAMPDLGISANVIRMRGGFFTGMYVRWESGVPFVPVDTTINSCGVAVYTLERGYTPAEMKKALLRAQDGFGKAGLTWNFSKGNHFIICGTLDDGSPCAVLHASADEYKRLYRDKALYPYDDVWYSGEMKILRDEENSGRYLRYISGSAAEKFISTAVSLPEVNSRRMDTAAELVFGSLIKERINFTSHYGMPDNCSAAIGCSWNGGRYVLLSSNGSDVYIIRQESKDEISLNPHGFGVELSDNSIGYDESGLKISGKTVMSDADLSLISRKVRSSGSGNAESRLHAEEILRICPGIIENTVHPEVTVSAEGIRDFTGAAEAAE